jgi:hypothetical protein
MTETMRDMIPRRGQGRSWGVAFCVASAVSACAGVRNTPEQDLANARWRACAPPSGLVQIDRVEADGRIWFSYFLESDRQAMVACIGKPAPGGPSLPEPVGTLRAKGGA